MLGLGVHRNPQSVQSVPYAQLVPMACSPPSWQCELFAYGPPCPNECAWHSSEHSIGGGADGGGGDGDGAEGEGGGGDGGDGGDSGGGMYSRGPQSAQSVPRSHCAPMALA